MAFDAHANLAISQVANAPSPANSGTSLTVTAGQGALFPAVPFNCTVFQSGVLPTASNAEIIRVTAIATDTFTIVRAQEGTTAQAILVGWQIENSATKKTFTDIENSFPANSPTLVQFRGTQSVASAAGTTTLTVTSPRQTIITGSATQIIVLPNATTLPFTDWSYEIVNQSTNTIQIQTNGGALLFTLPSGGDVTLNCTSIATSAGTWQYLNPAGVAAQAVPIPRLFGGLHVWGHSWAENPLTGATYNSLGTNSNELFDRIFADACGITGDRLYQHARTGSMVTGIGRGGSTGGGHFAKMLAEIVRTKNTTPFSRSGDAHLIVWGINDIGNNTAANQSLMRSCAQDIYTVLISKARSSVIFNAQGGTNLAFGTNFANAAAAAQDWTSGFAKSCTAVDSGGTSTVTFTIPSAYQGEPICFALGGLQAGSLILTIGGTAGLTGTITLSNRALNSNSIVPYRVTTLTSANAGQTITLAVTTISSSTFYFDGCWLEALKPNPVLVCNCARLPQRTINFAIGDGVTTGTNTSFTSATAAQFSSTGGWYDVGATITETDAQGAFTGNTNTISSVTNATTVVLGTNAAAAKTNIKCTFTRQIRGYSSGLYWTTNTDFTGATVASHSAADTDVTNFNSMLTTVVALFDSMVQIVNLDAAVGSDANVPSNAYSFFNTDGGHFNALGAMKAAQACWTAASLLQPPTTDPLALTPGDRDFQPGYANSPYLRIRRSGQYHLPDGATFAPVANLYTAVAGDCFAVPFYTTGQSEFWGNVLMDQANAGTSVVAVGVYDDVQGVNGASCYPGCLVISLANATMNGSAATQSIGSLNRTIYPGLNWLVMIVQSIGTASTYYTMFGSMQMPGWNGLHLGTAANLCQATAWKVTGVAAGAMPTVFPSGGVIVGTNLSQTAQAVPVMGVNITVQ